MTINIYKALVSINGHMVAKKSRSRVQSKSATKRSAAKKAAKAKSAPKPSSKPVTTPTPTPSSHAMSLSTLFFILLAGALFIIGFFVGLTAAMSGGAEDHHNDATSAHDHGYDMVDISYQSLIPEVSIAAYKDAESGYNIRMVTTNFQIVPEHASTVFVENEGHAHLYLNGEKIARVYGEWYHIPNLEPGTHTLRVVLNSHDHKDLMVNGQVIAATTTITV